MGDPEKAVVVVTTTTIDSENPAASCHPLAGSSATPCGPSLKDFEISRSENCSENCHVDGSLVPSADSLVGEGSCTDDTTEKERDCSIDGCQIGIPQGPYVDGPEPPAEDCGNGSAHTSVPDCLVNPTSVVEIQKHVKPNIRREHPHSPKTGKLTRSSCYHGVSKNRWTGRFEAHLWDGSFQLEGRKRKGKLVYLGGYDSEEIAGRAHDLAAIKYWGSNSSIKLNFSVSDYWRDIEEMRGLSREEYVASLIRRSSCFSRGASIYRGVTRKKDGRWQARIGRISDRKDIYLGTYDTEEEAAQAYDIAAVKLKGINAVTNFDISNYSEDLE